jgi:hypothetical protein
MIPQEPLFHKPKDIIAAKNIIYTTMFIGVVVWAIVNWSAILPDRGNPEGIVIAVVNLVIQYLLAWQIGLGRQWARTVYLLIFILGMVGVLYMISILKSNIFLATLCLLQVILQILALKFLFSQKSTLWFHSVRSFVRDK